MFSGIVEAQSKVLSQSTSDHALRIEVERPSHFEDIKIGDSISTNGVCLTIEKFNADKIQFCLGAETLKLLGEGLMAWTEFPLNLERSLRLGDRVHGHLVTGHVDSLAKILKAYADGECWQMQVEIPDRLISYFWKKGSVCMNGVSLTVNEVHRETGRNWIEVCLIPETIQKTNLKHYQPGQYLNIESDYLAKAYISSQSKNEGPSL
jgi:riboflavin synthase